MEIEAKTTKHQSFSLKLKDWNKLYQKTAASKISVMVVQFEGKENRELAVISYEDFKYLLRGK